MYLVAVTTATVVLEASSRTIVSSQTGEGPSAHGLRQQVEGGRWERSDQVEGGRWERSDQVKAVDGSGATKSRR